MIINFQNRAPRAKTLARQDSGQLPLYLGPALHGKPSSADITVDHFLAYFDIISGYCAKKNDYDGNAALLVISDTGAAEITPADLLAGLAAGHLGPEAQKKAQAFIAKREEDARKSAEWAAEQRAMRTGAVLRDSI